MSDATVLRLRARDLEWRSVDAEVVALDVVASVYLATNISGSRLWRALADGATRAQLTADLVETYAIDADVAAADVDAFLGSLRARGLLDE